MIFVMLMAQIFKKLDNRIITQFKSCKNTVHFSCKSFIAFTSTAKGGTISKIKPILTPGAVVTTSKNDVDYIVTEYGVAHLRGRSLGERARQLIAIAHPDFRDELTFEAKKRGMMI